MGTKIWNPPPDIRQDYGDTCWAAVIEAFCKSSKGRPQLTQAQIVEQFDQFTFSQTDGTMSRSGLHKIIKDKRFGMKSEEITADYFSSTLEYLPQRLKKGMVVIGYWEKRIPGWHVALIYGVDGETVYYLNPDYLWGGLDAVDLSFFSEKSNLVIGYRTW